jgi:aerobic-type carbon monoxide dehydrogenase small subunit (CoxS/CutS family)
MPYKKKISVTVNEKTYHRTVEVRQNLCDFLREELGAMRCSAATVPVVSFNASALFPPPP